MVALIALSCALLGWFLPGKVDLSNRLLSNDANHWPDWHRLTNAEEYLQWHRGIPDNTAMFTTYSPPGTLPINFQKSDLVIAPIPTEESMYRSVSSRLNGWITMVHGQRHNEGGLAQQISIPDHSALHFQPYSTALLADTMAIIGAIGTAFWICKRKRTAGAV